MSRADLEAAAAEKYPQPKKVVGASSLGEVTYTYGPVPRSERAAYIQGRLDQAEADAREVLDARGQLESAAIGLPLTEDEAADLVQALAMLDRIAAAIREGSR